MATTLTPELEREVAQHLASGRYVNGEAVLRAALQALHDWEEAGLSDDVQEAIAVSEREFAEGKGIAWDDIRGEFHKGFPNG